MGRPRHISLKVWGDYACFTNPAFSVERWSYPVITPTAARGILNTIYFHPELCWIITQINVLKPVRWHGFGTNEIDQCIRRKDVKKVMSDDYRGDVMVTDERRLQFHNLILKDVAYVIHAYVGLLPQYRNCPQVSEQEHKEEFQKRVRNGQCRFTPWLGQRDYLAYFDEPTSLDHPVDITEPLGMLTLEIIEKNGAVQPVFFNAFMKGGRIKVPRVGAMLSCYSES